MTNGAYDNEQRLRQVLIYEDDDGLYTAALPSLPDCEARGATIEEAIENTRAAVAECIAGLTERGEPIPEETHQLAHVAVDITPPDCHDLSVFTPVKVSSQGIEWARRRLQELRAAGLVH
jgi:antitoxin HicB